MHKLNLEQIPDILIGRLLQRNLVAYNININHDLDQNLCLFVSINFGSQIPEELHTLFLTVSQTSAEFFIHYPELKRLVVRAESSSWRLPSKSHYLYISNEDLTAWYKKSSSDEVFLAGCKEYKSDPFQEGEPHYWRSWI